MDKFSNIFNFHHLSFGGIICDHIFLVDPLSWIIAQLDYATLVSFLQFVDIQPIYIEVMKMKMRM